MASSNHIRALKPVIFIIAVAIVIIVALFAYMAIEFSHIKPIPPAPSKVYTPHVTGTLVSQNLLLYNDSHEFVPYELVGYKAINATSLLFNASIFSMPAPSVVYVLNASNECYECGNMSQFFSALKADILSYGLVNATSISNVSMANVGSISNYSILIVPNGLLPKEFLEPVNSSTNMTLLDLLMSKSTIIIYIGSNFSRLLMPGSIIVPSSLLPSYLDTVPYSYKGKSPFYFNSTTFDFSSGYTYGPLTYNYVGLGVIIAFSNSLNTWKSPAEAASDVSEAIFKSFWIPEIASGEQALNTTKMNSSGVIGMPLVSSTLSPMSSLYSTILNSSFGRIAIKANFSSSKGSKTNYTYIYFSPVHKINGTISIPALVMPGSTIQVPMTIFTNSSAPISVQPHLSIYNINMSSIYTIPLPFMQAYGNFTFIKYINFNLPPGEYIASLQGYSGNQYAAALFNITPVDITISSANFTANAYKLHVYSMGLPISGINYTISLNGAYKSSGIIEGGVINYSLPAGTPQIYGNIKFTITMLSSSFTYSMTHSAPKISVNKQYIEIAIVVIVVLLMVTLVKAPNRDEFYIDMPMMPQQKKIDINVPVKDILSQFDKLNVRYHWKFMPLSKSELRFAISSNLRYNNMPVGITYSNADLIVDQLVVKGYLVSADDLYAPSEWQQKSGHDIEYLSIFKKLRIYLVTHAYMFTDLDVSNLADIVTTIHGERTYIVIYSKTSKFLKVPLYSNQTTYIAFLNAFKLEEFKEALYAT
ncbi:MAG: hypothetical protein QXW10_04410, partial [Candidatus Micrarchaeaceae archaeon]